VRRRFPLLLLLSGLVALAAAPIADSTGADLCIRVGKLPPGITLPPGTKSPPGYIRLPPGITVPGAVKCPSAGGSAGTGASGGRGRGGSGPATYAGVVSGTPIPAPGAGRGGVLALALPGGAVAATSTLTPSGRYSLKLPAGTYALVTWLADLKRGTFVEVASALVHATAGQKRTLPLTTTLRKRKLTVARGIDLNLPPGFTTVPPPAGEKWVLVDTFPGGTGDNALLAKGMQDMLTTDLIQAAEAEKARSGCIVKVSGLNNRIEDLINELRLQETPSIDPATRVPRGHWVAPNGEIRGAISESAANHTVTASVEVIEGGRTVGTASRTVSDDNIFDLSPLLAKDVIRVLCSVPTAYTATLDGTAHLARSPGEDINVAWSGTMQLAKLGDAPGGPGGAPGTWRAFGVVGGSVHVTISGSGGDCSISGSADAAAGATDGNLNVRTDGTRHPYEPVMAWGGASVPITLTGSDSCSGTGDIPLSGGYWARLDSPANSSSFALEGSADRTLEPGFTEHMHWVFTPRGSG
jgi:hypothetical protein